MDYSHRDTFPCFPSLPHRPSVRENDRSYWHRIRGMWKYPIVLTDQPLVLGFDPHQNGEGYLRPMFLSHVFWLLRPDKTGDTWEFWVNDLSREILIWDLRVSLFCDNPHLKTHPVPIITLHFSSVYILTSSLRSLKSFVRWILQFQMYFSCLLPRHTLLFR